MDYQIKELIKQGFSRNEIFEKLKKSRGCSVGDFRVRALVFNKGSTVSSHGIYGCEEG